MRKTRRIEGFSGRSTLGGSARFRSTPVSYGLGLSKHRFFPKDRLAETHSAISRQRSCTCKTSARQSGWICWPELADLAVDRAPCPRWPRRILSQKSLGKNRGFETTFGCSSPSRYPTWYTIARIRANRAFISPVSPPCADRPNKWLRTRRGSSVPRDIRPVDG
jgi:hypothetical protein